MSLPYQPNGIRFSANMGLSPGVQPIAQNHNPGQYSITGGPGVMPYTPTTGTTGPVMPPGLGAALGAASNGVNAFNQGVASLGGPFSGIAPNPAHVSSNPFYINGRTAYSGPNGNITQLQPFQQNGFANVTNKVAAAQPQAPLAKPPEPTQNIWGGGFGKSDNSAWGNALGPTLEQRQGLGGQFQPAANQPSGHVNQALPPGYGSVFGLGAGGK